MTISPPHPISRTAYYGCAALGVAAMLANFAPSPLYAMYEAEWGISDATVGLVFAAYSIGTMLVLLLLGGLSDVWGRRRVLHLCGAGLCISVTLMMLAWHPAVLVAGRLLQGVSTGVMTATIAATLMESHPRGDLAAGARTNTLTFSLGSALGPLVSGMLAAAAPWPLRLPYATILVALALGLAVVSSLPREQVVPPTKVSHLVRRPRVPRTIRRPFLLACGALLLHNCGQGVIGAFAAHFSTAVGGKGASDAGLIVFAALAMMAAPQVFFRRIAPGAALLGGAALTSIGWACLLASIHTGAPLLLWVGVLTGGAAGGLTFLGSATLVGHVSPIAQRAEIYAAYLFSAFVGMTVPALVVGVALRSYDLERVILALTVMLWLGALWVTAGTLRTIDVRRARPGSRASTRRARPRWSGS